MTPVKFEFYEPDGTPLANAQFEIKMAKSGFLDPIDGIVMPDTVLATTDEFGVTTVLLKPSSSLYYVRVVKADADDECCGGGIFYKFYVPDVATVVRVQDLIMEPPPSTTAWDEAAMLAIMDAKIASKASADAAKESELIVVATAEQVATDAALVAELTPQVADNAAAAKLSEDNSKMSENASRASELAAAASADFAASVVQDAQEQVDEATRQAGLATDAKDTAVLAASAAHTDAGKTAADVVTTTDNVATTETNKLATAQDVVAVTTLKGEVNTLKEETKVFRDEAQAAVGTITGVITDGGQIDLSGGVYPAKPTISTVWRVTVGGVIASDGVDYGVGDQLFYTKAQDYFYKQDSTESVSSVAGRKGAVVLAPTDVGLGQVNNTSDLNKPISNAQQIEFDKRTVTTTSTDVTVGRITKVGDYGENGGAAIPRIATDDANNLTVPGTYAFANGGVNVPEAAYIKHIGSETAGYAKQLAYGILTDKQYVRTQKAGVWGAWTSAVEIIDALTSTDPNKALSAKQGKVLYDLLLANNATITKFTYSLTAGQTAVSGADIYGKTLSYVPNTPMLVDKDGFAIQISKDYTASNGTLLTLITAAEQASELSITVFGSFTVADHYTKGETDVLLQNVAAQSAEALLTIKWVPSRAMVGLGTVPMDGGLYSRTTYPDAWALIRDGKVPVVTETVWGNDLTARASFTVGDGSTNFRVPDYNGKSAGSYQALFVRGDGNNTGAAGVIQRDALQGHQHAVNIKSTAGASSTYGFAGYGTGQTSQYGTEGAVTAGREAVETRPINVAGVWTIRLFGSVSNVGNIDVAQIAAQLNTLDNAAYKRANILGVVSQAAGVPTGAIIENIRSTSGNTTFTTLKHADGTMIQTAATLYTTIGTGTPAAAMFSGSAAPALNYPVAFTSLQYVNQVFQVNGLNVFCGAEVSSLTQWAQAVPLSLYNTGATAYTGYLYREARGRWY